MLVLIMASESEAELFNSSPDKYQIMAKNKSKLYYADKIKFLIILSKKIDIMLTKSKIACCFNIILVYFNIIKADNFPIELGRILFNNASLRKK